MPKEDKKPLLLHDQNEATARDAYGSVERASSHPGVVNDAVVPEQATPPHSWADVRLEPKPDFESPDGGIEAEISDERRSSVSSHRPGAVARPCKMNSGLVVPPGVTLTWHGVNAFGRDQGGKNGNGSLFNKVKKLASKKKRYTGSQKKHILKDVFGVAEAGELMAIMGSSGAGKSTLLNVLTKRNLSGLTVDGQVLVNGQRATKELMRLLSAYVQQDDLFIGTLTVREHLWFYAQLRMGSEFTKNDRIRRIDDVILDLNLKKCEHTLIGSTMKRGISGGEKKRLAFASELLTNPTLMFCDEPTSGLDSFMAQQVVGVLKQLAHASGRTVVCTIHQPSSQVFALFDKVYLMSEGRIAYMGPTKAAIDFFDRVGFPSPGNFNPADHYIRVLSVVPRHERTCKRRIKEICNAYRDSPMGRAADTRASQPPQSLSSSSDAQNNDATMVRSFNAADRAKGKLTVGYRASWLQQMRALLWRSSLAVIREPLLLRVRLFQTIITSLITGVIYLNSPASGAAYVQNVQGALFQICANVVFGFVFAVVDTFCKELPIFLREHFSGMYRVDAYYLAKILSEAPIYILLPFIFSTIVYWMAGLYGSADAYFINGLLAVLTCNSAISVGYAISCVAGNINLALVITPVIVIPSMLFGGFYLNTGSVPVYFDWLKYLSFFKYSYEGMCVNQWSHIGAIPGCENGTCPATGMEVIEQWSFSADNLWPNIAILFVYILVVRLLGFIALLTRTMLKK